MVLLVEGKSVLNCGLDIQYYLAQFFCRAFVGEMHISELFASEGNPLPHVHISPKCENFIAQINGTKRLH